MPPEVFVAYKQARKYDRLPMVITGTFERESESVTQFGAEDRTVFLRVKKVFLESCDQGTFGFGLSYAVRDMSFVPEKEYHVVAIHTRHGAFLQTVIPVAQEPNQSVEPTPGSVTPRATERPSK